MKLCFPLGLVRSRADRRVPVPSTSLPVSAPHSHYRHTAFFTVGVFASSSRMTSGILSATLLTPHKLARTLVGIHSSLYLSPATSDPSGWFREGELTTA